MPTEHTSIRLGEVADAIPESANLSAECREYLRRKYVAQDVKTVEAEDVDRMNDALGELRDALEDINDASARAIEQIDTLRDVAANAEADVERSADVSLEDALRPLATLSDDKRHAENPAVQRKANALGIDPEDVLTELADRYPTDRLGNPTVDFSQTEDAITG